MPTGLFISNILFRFFRFYLSSTNQRFNIISWLSITIYFEIHDNYLDMRECLIDELEVILNFIFQYRFGIILFFYTQQLSICESHCYSTFRIDC